MPVDDSLLRSVRPRSSILDELDRVAAPETPKNENQDDLPGPDKLSPLPQPGDPYQAHSHSDRKPLPTVRFVMRDGTFEGFAYGDMRRFRMAPSADPGSGPVIELRFVAEETTEVRIEGRKLDKLFDLVGYHKIAWIRELPPKLGFTDPTEPVVTRITIRPLEL
jgi:hypothetical protein